jgi:hypothetical protein
MPNWKRPLEGSFVSVLWCRHHNLTTLCRDSATVEFGQVWEDWTAFQIRTGQNCCCQMTAKILNRPNCWSTLTAKKTSRSTQCPAWCLRIRAFATGGGKEHNARALNSRGSHSPRDLLVEKPRCQTLKSRVRNATPRLPFQNANRSIIGNVT